MSHIIFIYSFFSFLFCFEDLQQQAKTSSVIIIEKEQGDKIVQHLACTDFITSGKKIQENNKGNSSCSLTPAGVGKVWERGTLLPGNDKKKWGNHDMSVNGVWREIFSLKLCSWKRKQFVHSWTPVQSECTIVVSVRSWQTLTMPNILRRKFSRDFASLWLWDYAPKLCSWNIWSRTITHSLGKV